MKIRMEARTRIYQNAFCYPKLVLHINSVKYDSRKFIFIPQGITLFISSFSKNSQPFNVLGMCPCFGINKIITIMVNNLK